MTGMITRSCVAAVAIGLIGGSVVDCGETIPEPERRGEFVVLRGDFHTHTRLGDGFLSHIEIVLAARREVCERD